MEKSLATPEQPQSSVFMTPSTSSSSNPFSLHPRPRILTPVPFCLLSPAATPGGSSMELPSPPEHKDILSELYEKGMPLVSQQILAYLEPAELCSSLRVCKTWRHQISSNTLYMDKIITYRRQCKENAENLEKLYKPITAAPAQRTALATIAPNRMSQVQTAKPVRVPFSQGITTKQRPCPNCQSPAKELNLRRAECTNCQFDFCQHCFKPWHEGECSGRMSPSKRPRQTETVCGTKKSKKRLRRL